MKPYTITITRQFGSLGRNIGERVAELLQCKYYDREQIETEAAQRDTLLAPLVDLQKQNIEGYYKMAYPLGIGSALKKDKMFEVQSTILREHAQKECCVIVGRCADYVLRDMERVLRCYIYAPDAIRIANRIHTLDVPVVDYKPLMAEVDKQRAAYYEKYTGYPIDNLELRDLVLNSACLDIEGTAELIAAAARKKFGLTE